MGNLNDYFQGTKFSFRQVLIGVHKRFMLHKKLPDTEEFEAKRIIPQQRLNLLKIRLGRMIIANKCKRSKIKNMKAFQSEWLPT
jgi:hypothetical protein